MFAASPRAVAFAAVPAWRGAAAARVLLLGAVLLAAGAPASADTQCTTPLADYRLETWQQEDGLPADTLYAIAQARDGTLYMGSEAGLARFDGLMLEVVPLGSTGSAMHVPVLASDGTRLYAGTGSGDIFALGANGAAEAAAGNFDKPVEALLLEGHHRLAGLRGGGLVDFSVQPPRVLGPDEGLASSRVTALASRGMGGAWVATGGHGVYWYDGERLQRDPRTAGLDQLSVEALLEDRQGQLWIAAREGLARVGPGGAEWYGPEQGLPSGLMRSLMLDTTGTLWVGTGANGLARLCDGRFEMLGVDGGLPIGLVEAVLEDAQGDVWVASGGLVRLSRGAAVAMGPAQGLPDAPALPILTTVDGGMVVGSFGGGAVDVRGAAVTPLVTEGALASPHVLGLAQSPDGTVWVGTRAGVEAVRDGRVVARFGTAEGLPGPATPALLHDGARLWVGTSGGAATIEDGTLSVLATPAGGFGAHVVHIFQDASGQVWLGTDGAGLFRAVDGRAQAAVDIPLPSNVVLGMYEAPQGVLWIATGDGLARWDGTRLGTIQVAQGLPENAVQSIMLDTLGNLWLSGVRGVHSAPLAQLEAVARGAAAQVAFRTFTRRDGMPRTETNGGIQPAVARASDGRLWYPTAAGVAVFDPVQAWGARVAPVPSLRSVQVDEARAVPVGEALQIAPNPGVVRLAYVAPSLRHAHEVAYQYRLVGFDAGWFDAGNAREAIYRQLPPGEFVFEVRARLPGNQWSAPASLPLTVQPHLFERRWVHALLVLTAAALLLALALWIRRRRNARRQLRQQQQRLDALGLLAGGIAHDFSAVLDRISAGGVTLVRAIPPNHPLQAGIGEIVRASEHGTDLVNRLRAFATTDRGTPQQIDLASAVAAMQPMLSRLVPPAVKLELRTTPAGVVRIDPMHLEQVVGCLVMHACSTAGARGPIRITVTTTSSGGQHGNASMDTGEAMLSVSDSGPGMRAEERARIFDPFFASTRSTAGLELAAAYGLVRSAGGRIEVESAPGKGTTFQVVLPLLASVDVTAAGDGAQRNGDSSSAPLPHVGWQAAGRRLLVLIDDAASMQLLREIAAVEDFSTRFADGASDFFAVVEQWQPSHVALGLVLSGTDGIEVLQRLATIGFGGQVILTSQRGRKVLDAAYRSGVEHGLTMSAGLERPLQPADIRAALTGAQAPAGPRPGKAAERLLSQKDFEHALAHEELLLHFQPKIDLANGRTVAFEALVRWQHPTRGLVFPDVFIPLAEQTGLVEPMTQQVVRMALDWLAALDDPTIGLSINLSARSLNDSQAIAQLEAHCRTRGIAPARVTLELTETSAMLDPVEALDTLTQLRLKGFELALDDFGTGYSSMIQLARLPFSQIKVDKSFVMSLTVSTESRKIVESTITLGQSLGLTTIAEGVEDAAALDMLRELGCERAQGYYIARPMDGVAARQWLLAQRRD